MMDEKTYKKEIVRMWDSIRDDEYKGTETCAGVTYCDVCPLYDIGCGESSNAFEMIKAIEKWSSENPPKKYKVLQLEYDILYNALDFSSNDDTFDDVDILHGLLENGYFNGATNGMRIREYFENCEIEVDEE